MRTGRLVSWSLHLYVYTVCALPYGSHMTGRPAYTRACDEYTWASYRVNGRLPCGRPLNVCLPVGRRPSGRLLVGWFAAIVCACALWYADQLVGMAYLPAVLVYLAYMRDLYVQTFR